MEEEEDPLQLSNRHGSKATTLDQEGDLDPYDGYLQPGIKVLYNQEALNRHINRSSERSH